METSSHYLSEENRKYLNSSRDLVPSLGKEKRGGKKAGLD
jgi:hypothetical protein